MKTAEEKNGRLLSLCVFPVGKTETPVRSVSHNCRTGFVLCEKPFVYRPFRVKYPCREEETSKISKDFQRVSDGGMGTGTFIRIKTWSETSAALRHNEGHVFDMN